MTRDPSSSPALVGAPAISAHRARPPLAGRAPARVGGHDLGPPLGRPPARPAGGLRLHRRRGRDRDEPPALTRRLHPGRVRPQRPARRVEGRPVDDDPWPAVGDAAGLRPDRLHAADAPGGRAGRGPCGRAAGHPVRAVDPRDDVARGPRRRGARRGPVVPALPLERPRGGARPRPAGARRPASGR